MRWLVPLVALIGCSGSEEVGGDVSTGADASEASGSETASSDVAPTDAEPPDTVDTIDAVDAVDAAEAREDDGDADAADDAGVDVDADARDAGPTIAERCFPGIDPAATSGPVYDPFAPTIGSHCFGTNHQDITGVERVVFLGDSVTVGSPNLGHLLSIDNAHFYRNLLADHLAARFDLDKGDALSWGAWRMYDYFTGRGTKKESGDFMHCAKWGARTDDFVGGGAQLGACFPSGGSAKRTLVVFTMGGNDIAAITKAGAEASEAEVAAGYPSVRAQAAEAVALLDEAVAWLKDPARFPAGSFVVFANPFEFTDATGRTDACSPRTVIDIPGIGEIDLSTLDVPVATFAGIGTWADPGAQKEIVIGILEGYMEVATRHQADLVFLLEHFCGHGYVATGPEADVDNACYQGPEAALWFDETCIHPSDAGHRALFEMFAAVIGE